MLCSFLTPLVTLEAAVAPRHSERRMLRREWEPAALRRLAPASQWTQWAGSSQSPDHTSLLPQGMRAAAEPGVGEVPFLLTLPQHRSGHPAPPDERRWAQDRCANEGGRHQPSPGPWRPLTTCLFCCSSGQDRSSWGLA